MNFINIRISSNKLDFDSINEHLDFENQCCYKKGESIEHKGQKITYKEDIWQYKIETSDNELLSTFELLVEKLYKQRDFLIQLSKNSDATLWITFYPDRYQTNFRLNNELIKKIVAIGFNFDISIMKLDELYS